MDFPPGLSHKEAKKLIVNAEQLIFEGRNTSNLNALVSTCDKCGVNYKSETFDFCPVCYLRANSKKIDVKDTKNYTTSYDWISWVVITLLVLAVSLVFGFGVYSILNYIF